MLRYLSQGNRWTVLGRAGLFIAIIALVDWKVESNLSLGVLYLFPMMMIGACLSFWEIALVAVLCTTLVESFAPFAFVPHEAIPRMILEFAAFFGSGLFVFESTKRRQLALHHLQEIEREIELRREAEEQLKVLVESSPAAIFTLDQDGRVLLANQAAYHLLAFEGESLVGAPMEKYLPALKNVPPLTGRTQSFRTEMECPGRRRNGEVFLASVWFATYRTQSGPRLAAVVIDISENLRDREESSLQQFMANSRIVVATVCHEIRNLCSAITMVQAKLGRDPSLRNNEQYQALANLVDGLDKIASLELRLSAGGQATKAQMNGIDLAAVLDELRIIVEPALVESGIEVQWNVPATIPLVWADRQTLLQVFLNLTKNSTRALENSTQRILRISVEERDQRVLVRVEDSGPGISAPERLFQPFQPGAESTGLGLYVSRALVRGFGGELSYEPRAEGCCFMISLNAAATGRLEPQRHESTRQESGPEAERVMENGSSAASSTGRSHTFSREPGTAARK